MEKDLITLSKEYSLPVGFVKKFYNTMTDKGNIEMGLKMFVNGTLPFSVATGNKPFCVKDILNEVTNNFIKANKNRLESIAESKKVDEYLASV